MMKERAECEERAERTERTDGQTEDRAVNQAVNMIADQAADQTADKAADETAGKMTGEAGQDVVYEKYGDIIHLPHHVSARHPQMPMYERAAQFAPFAALTGHEEAVREAARLTKERVELSEDEKEILNRKIQGIGKLPAEVSVTYFVEDARKAGGAYVTETVRLKRIEPDAGSLVTEDGRRIAIMDIVDLL